jgi:phenylalanyl-tRNA synthetase beta chain
LAPTSLNYLYSPHGAEIFLAKKKIGFFGRIHPSITQKYQINGPIFVAQISLTIIFDYLDNYFAKFCYQPVSNFPTSTKDLSFIFPENIDYTKVIKEIRKATDQNLQEVSVFDIYQSIELEKERKKSVSLHLIFQSPNKTLENKEIERALRNITERVEKVFAAKLRD